MTFKVNSNFNQRYTESQKIRIKYPDRIPIICEPLFLNSMTDPILDKTKYLAPMDITIGQFQYVIRKRIRLKQDKTIFLFINENLYNSSQLLSYIDDKEKDDDGFLYIKYGFENTFG